MRQLPVIAFLLCLSCAKNSGPFVRQHTSKNLPLATSVAEVLRQVGWNGDVYVDDRLLSVTGQYPDTSGLLLALSGKKVRRWIQEEAKREDVFGCTPSLRVRKFPDVPYLCDNPINLTRSCESVEQWPDMRGALIIEAGDCSFTIRSDFGDNFFDFAVMDRSVVCLTPWPSEASKPRSYENSWLDSGYIDIAINDGTLRDVVDAVAAACKGDRRISRYGVTLSGPIFWVRYPAFERYPAATLRFLSGLRSTWWTMYDTKAERHHVEIKGSLREVLRDVFEQTNTLPIMGMSGCEFDISEMLGGKLVVFVLDLHDERSSAPLDVGVQRQFLLTHGRQGGSLTAYCVVAPSTLLVCASEHEKDVYIKWSRQSLDLNALDIMLHAEER